MKPTHYHTSTIFTLVTIHVNEDTKRAVTSDGYHADTIELYPVSDILGKIVTMNGHVGIVKDVLSTNTSWVGGKYNMGRYLMPKPLTRYCDQLGIFWTNINTGAPSPYYWNSYSQLTFSND